MASSSSDEGNERVPFGPNSTRIRRPSDRLIKRVFVHLPNRPRNSATPRGGVWDGLERDGRVKTLSFKLSQSSESMANMVRSNFPSVAREDFERIRFYSSRRSGADMECVFRQMPHARDLADKFPTTDSIAPQQIPSNAATPSQNEAKFPEIFFISPLAVKRF